MLDKITVNVVLTKQDMKQFFFTLNTALIILDIVAAGLLFLAVLFYISMSVMFVFFSPLTVALFVFLFLFIAGMMLLSLYIKYRRFTEDFEKSGSDRNIVYEFDRRGFVVTTTHGQMAISWSDIMRLVEYPAMYLIVQSVGKVAVVPKKSFYGPMEHAAFAGLLTQGVAAKKLKLKNIPFYAYAPAAPWELPPISAESAAEEARNTNEPPLFELKTIMTKSDYLRYNYYHYYSKPSGILMTLLGLILPAFVIWSTNSADMDMGIIATILLPVLGAWLLLGAPLLILAQGRRMYKTDTTIRDALSTYSFYSGHMTIENEKGINTRRFGEFRSLVRTKAFYLLYISRNMAYVLPRRCIEDTAAFDAYFDFMKTENARLKERVN